MHEFSWDIDVHRTGAGYWERERADGVAGRYPANAGAAGMALGVRVG